MKLLELAAAALESHVGKSDRQTGSRRRAHDALSERVVAVDTDSSAVAGGRKAHQRFSCGLRTRRAC